MEEDRNFTERWLERIDTTVKEGFARMEAKLDQKADKADVQQLNNQVFDVTVRVRTLEDKRLEAETWHKALNDHEDTQLQHKETKIDNKKTNLALFGTALAVATSIGQFVHSLLQH